MIWLTSDLHIGHDKIAHARGYPTTTAHDHAITRGIHRRVNPRDDLFILGDAALGNKQTAAELIATLPGRKHLILGNHDRQHPLNGNTHNPHDGDLRDVFNSVQLATTLRHGGTVLLLSHFPYDGDPQPDDRHTQWRLPDHGTPLLHGHMHDTTRARRSRRGTAMVHVGVDAWGMAPVPLGEAAHLARSIAHESY